MPVFLVTAITSFTTWLGGLFGASIAFFSLQTAKRVAIIVAVIAFMIASALALADAFLSIINSLTVVIPNEIIVASTWVFPDTTANFIGAMITLRVARFLFDFFISTSKLTTRS